MKDSVLIGFFLGSWILSIIHFTVSLIIVAHIFGLLISVTMFFISSFYLFYILILKKKET